MAVSSIAITPSLSNTLRDSEQYYVEIVMAGFPDTTFPNVQSVDVSNLLREAHQQKGGSKIYNFSVSDYYIKHGTGFVEPLRQPVVLQCRELSRSKSRYLTIFASDQGVALSGANSAVVKELPNRLTFELGKINLTDPGDFTVYHPNDDKNIGAITSPSQSIEIALIRFSLTIQYLTETT
jgi:hypothetical protein